MYSNNDNHKFQSSLLVFLQFHNVKRPIDHQIFLQGDPKRAYHPALKWQSRHFSDSPG